MAEQGQADSNTSAKFLIVGCLLTGCLMIFGGLGVAGWLIYTLAEEMESEEKTAAASASEPAKPGEEAPQTPKAKPTKEEEWEPSQEEVAEDPKATKPTPEPLPVSEKPSRIKEPEVTQPKPVLKEKPTVTAKPENVKRPPVTKTKPIDVANLPAEVEKPTKPAKVAAKPAAVQTKEGTVPPRKPANPTPTTKPKETPDAISARIAEVIRKAREARKREAEKLRKLAEERKKLEEAKTAQSQHVAAGPGSTQPSGEKEMRTPRSAAPELGSGGTRRLVIKLEVKRGAAPGGARSKGGWPYKLSQTRPSGVRVPPPGRGLLYGRLPIEGKGGFFAIQPPRRKGQPAVFFVDRNRDGNFTNDTPSRYRGSGTYRTAGSLAFDLARADRSTYPYYVWLWTTINHPSNAPHLSFNFYATCHRRGEVDLTIEGRRRRVPVIVADLENTGQFKTNKALLDWNANNRPESAEWIEVGASRRIGDKIVTLKSIERYGDSAVLMVRAAGASRLPDVLDELKKEPIEGNIAPDINTRDVSGKNISLGSYRGKIVLLNFWSTTCKYCIKKLPALKKLNQQYHARGLRIIGVSLDRNLDTLRAYVRTQGLQWPQICQG